MRIEATHRVFHDEQVFSNQPTLFLFKTHKRRSVISKNSPKEIIVYFPEYED
jgi:hypothetical protein